MPEFIRLERVCITKPWQPPYENHAVAGRYNYLVEYPASTDEIQANDRKSQILVHVTGVGLCPRRSGPVGHTMIISKNNVREMRGWGTAV